MVVDPILALVKILPTKSIFCPSSIVPYSASFSESEGTYRTTMEDDMANCWGGDLVADIPLRGKATTIMLDNTIRNAIPGYRFLHILDSGTSANERAVVLATDGKIESCLYGTGSYVAGDGYLFGLTSSEDIHNNRRLALICPPDECTSEAQKQTVALPYHIPGASFDDNALMNLETRCLSALEQKLAMAAIYGHKKFTVLLLEYILSGCGGELTHRFLHNLGVLLTKWKVSVIADEVMTGGRIGPQMTMTTSMPRSFLQCVKFITMGKSVGCGLVLLRMSEGTSSHRGTTTEIDRDEAYWKFLAIQKRIERGLIEMKRNRVLKLLKLADVQHWGRGLLIFTSKSRQKTQGNFWNRMLPRLENGTKTKLVRGFTASDYDPGIVNKHIENMTNTWLGHMTGMYESDNISPYNVEFARFITTITGVDDMTFHPKEFNERLIDSQINETEILELHRARKFRRLGAIAGRCHASHRTLMYRALKDASTTSNGFVSIVRKSKKRTKYYCVQFKKI